MTPMPFVECAKRAEAVTKAGGRIYQKFNCESCHALITMIDPNIFYKKGNCPDCGHTTDLVRKGCGFMAVFTLGGALEDMGRLN